MYNYYNVQVCSFICTENIRKLLQRKICQVEFEKGSIRQRIYFPVFTLDIPVPLYILQGIIYHQNNYLLRPT